MSIEFDVSCNNCGFHKSFFIGDGIMPRSIEYAFSQIHPTRRSTLRKLMNEHAVHVSDYEHRVYRCKRCGQLRNSFWIKLIYDDDEVYETNCLCWKCKKPMTHVRDYSQIEGKSCPCCEEETLQVIEDMLWNEMDLSDRNNSTDLIVAA